MPPAPRSSIGRCTLYAHVRCIRQKERRDDRPVHRGLFADGDRRPLPRRRFVSGGASWSAVRSVAGPRVRLGSPSRRRRRRRCGGGAGGGAGLRGLCAAPRRQGVRRRPGRRRGPRCHVSILNDLGPPPRRPRPVLRRSLGPLPLPLALGARTGLGRDSGPPPPAGAAPGDPAHTTSRHNSAATAFC